MTINEAHKLLETDPTQLELLNCLESLSKEYGYIEGMKNAKCRIGDEKATLAEIEDLIEQLKQKLRLIKCTN